MRTITRRTYETDLTDKECNILEPPLKKHFTDANTNLLAHPDQPLDKHFQMGIMMVPMQRVQGEVREMSNSEGIRSIRQFCEELERHDIQIWNSSESLPEEVLQQFIGSEEEIDTAQSEAEELHAEEKIDKLPEDTIRIVLKHFVDGSPRTVNVGFLLGANGISYPVALSHVGAAAVAFENGRWRETGFGEKYLILASVRQGMGLNIQLGGKWELEDPLDQPGRQINLTDIAEMRSAAVRRARRIMKNCEKELVRKLSKDYPKEWIVVDGTLFDIEGYSDLKDVQVIGVSKSFTLDPIVIKGGKPQRIGYLVGMLRNLNVGWRSPVYKLTPDKNRPDRYTYMWFVRLHAARQSPISGVVKVELPPSECYLDPALRAKTINAISYEIFRLRNPYLYDNRRGESFLYPVYVAETLIKSKLSSVEKLKGIWVSAVRR
jgi:hypothetical protein